MKNKEEELSEGFATAIMLIAALNFLLIIGIGLATHLAILTYCK